MMPYASNTGTRRNLSTLERNGWGILITPAKPRPPKGFRFGIDNGAWGNFQQGVEFQGGPFERIVAAHGGTADFIVLPDIVAGGMESLDLSVEWLASGRLPLWKTLLLPVQDGMEAHHVTPVLKTWPTVGIFLGGSTQWKLDRMYEWGEIAHVLGRWYHVGRVNTARRVRLAHEAGANSFDGTSATMFSCTVPLLQNARNQSSLLTPARLA